jgi:predicted transcriptional regulator
MTQKEKVLSTLAEMVKDIPQPTSYSFIPRELILRLPMEWSDIYACLSALEEMGALRLSHTDTIQFSITEKGIALSRELAANKVNKADLSP